MTVVYEGVDRSNVTSSWPDASPKAGYPTDAAALADAIRSLLVDDAARAELGARGIARAAEFTWQKAAEETRALYERIQV